MTWWIAGATVATGAIGAVAGDKAADKVAAGNAAGIRETRRQFDTVVGLQRPYSVTGTGALNKLARLMGLPYSGYQDPEAAGGRGSTHLGSHDVVKMLKAGMTIDQIKQAGVYEPRFAGSAAKRLAKHGVTPEQILELQRGPVAGSGENGAQPGIVTPTGPDMSEFTNSPDYKFRREQAVEGIDASAAARSGALNGNTVTAQTDRASDDASLEFGNFFGRLAQIAGIGQNAANTTSQASQNTGNTVAGLLASTGNARASGVMGTANSISGALDTGLTNWMLQKGGYFDKPVPT